MMCPRTQELVLSQTWWCNLCLNFFSEYGWRMKVLCARCGKRLAAVGCMGEHDRDRHGCSGIGWGGCGECLRTWNIYRNILLRTMDERTRIKSLLE